MDDDSFSDLQQREKALREVIAGAHCILWEARVIKQPDETYDWKLQILSPDETRREFGFVRSEHSGTDNEVYAQRISREELAVMNETSGRALRNGDKGYHQEFTLRDAQGRKRYMSEDVRIIQIAPGVFNLIGVQVDITDRKRAEAALWRAEEQLRQSQKHQAVAHFAAGTAHYFKNLMLVIQSYTDRMRKNPEGISTKDIDMIQKAVALASDMNQRLLSFGRQPRPMKSVNMNALILDMDHMLRPILGSDVEFIAILDPKVNDIKADPGQIEQVIVNLTLNARDAMPLGGKLVVETLNIDVDEKCLSEDVNLRPGPYVLIVVTDTGYGMDSEIISHLYEPFYTTKGIARGAGLGLATVYTIITKTGGTIQVSSETGKGTRFKIYIPASVDTTPQIENEESRRVARPATEDKVKSPA